MQQSLLEIPEGVTDYPYTPYADLKDASVFITGGGTGIGAYLVYAFARLGARVGFVSLTPGPAENLVRAIEESTGTKAFFRPVDIRNVALLQQTMDEFTSQAGPVSVLVNNAARDNRHSVENLSAAEWDDSLNTNLRPYFFTAQSVVDGMRKAGRGSIINIGSNSSYLGLSGYPAYVTAKHANLGLTKALARELGPAGIRVNALCPGWVMTRRQLELWVTPDALQECLDQQSLKETVSGEHVADAALFLASSASRMITGQSLIIDGGRVMP